MKSNIKPFNKINQYRQKEWAIQWHNYKHSGKDQFGNIQQHFTNHVIKPYNLEIFKDKVVLDAGCGSGDKLIFLSPIVKKVIGIDLNTSETVKAVINSSKCSNIEFIEDDLSTIPLQQQFDIIISDGVIHHTNDPNQTFNNLTKMLKPKGLLMIMVYSCEGNKFNRLIMNKISSKILQKFPYIFKHYISIILAATLKVYGNFIVAFKLTKLPFYKYLSSYFLNMSFEMNILDIFDQINAPIVHYITKHQVEKWFSNDYDNINIFHEKGVTWIANGRKILNNE